MKRMPLSAQPQERVNSSRARLTPAQRSNFWPPVAAGYALWRARSLTVLSGEELALGREAALFLGLCRPQPGERWLDAGTSAGFYAGVLARAGAQVLAADLSPAMLAVARKREPAPQIEWAELNLEFSGLPSASFDGVTVGATLNETRDPARLLRELARLLRPGGTLWLMYAARTGTPAQERLARLGGLTFPDPAWVERQLPGLRRAAGARFGSVQFERYVGEAEKGATPHAPSR
ncbi:2-polyprenyl-6-hydroxyphenyl methylase / 3-demethylubiquinone-9 3-methyltransferase [Deinococcus reticulitermitis]|uniref:2-polyprenyl-6-hydroxyphenyl methylase / 3-demethylubiquinone-9 3-methyltransferase n=2 Tax=Deinococcus reticulitermitis TaxID=856736 RepID=A0A1H6WC52_9DEIO|nr:2-polyprenyl-6-hydroxyphenyl methylase / 3-demethylubiquinone-9 3-methyltransferase [Deinococcus reticulitermitis]